ncbi:MAG: alpha/beta hydrolase [Candidatus Woesearchaeota archaeon]
MREEVVLCTPDDHNIYCTFDSANHSQVVIFVHGFTGSQFEMQYLSAIHLFLKNGFDTCRFDFYSRKPLSRPLKESSVSSHVQDLRVVIDECMSRYEEVFLVGHSLGGVVILSSELSEVSAVVLWDPTCTWKSLEEKKAKFVSGVDAYVFSWGVYFLVSKELVSEMLSLDMSVLVSNVSVPCKFVFASNSSKYSSWKPFLSSLNAEVAVVSGASHGFVEEGALEELFSETISFLT